MSDVLQTALDAVVATGASVINGSFVDFESAAKIEVDGTILDFVIAMKALDAKVVFVETHVVSEEEFLVNLEDDEDEETSEEIDLREAFPSLAAQNVRIGQKRAMDFVCVVGSAIITKLVRAEWDEEFIDTIADARDSWLEASASS